MFDSESFIDYVINPMQKERVIKQWWVGVALLLTLFAVGLLCNDFLISLLEYIVCSLEKKHSKDIFLEPSSVHLST